MVRFAVLPLVVTLALATTADAQDNAAQLERAQQMLQAGDSQGAIALLAALVAASPDDPQLRYRLGQAQFVSGQILASIPNLERALAASGGSGAVQFVLGQAYLETGRLLEADRALTAAQAERPDHAPTALFRGMVCYQAGRLESADTYFAQASTLAPTWELPLFRRGTLAIDRDDPAAAIDLLERAAVLRPDDAQILLVLATARADLQEPVAALELIERAAAAAPGFEPALQALIERLDLLNREDELAIAVEALLAVDPDSPAALYQRARLRSLRGDLAAALDDVDAALATLLPITPRLNGVRPGDRWKRAGDLRPQAMHLQADLLSRAGRSDAALAAARRLVADHPEFADGHFLVGNLLRRAGDVEASNVALGRFKALSDARLARIDATQALANGDPARAAERFAAALASAPRDAASIVGLAHARRLLGQPAAALELLATARSIGAAAIDWYEQRVLALVQVGRIDQASQAFVDARRINLELTPEVWAAVIPLPPGCAGPGS